MLSAPANYIWECSHKIVFGTAVIQWALQYCIGSITSYVLAYNNAISRLKLGCLGIACPVNSICHNIVKEIPLQWLGYCLASSFRLFLQRTTVFEKYKSRTSIMSHTYRQPAYTSPHATSLGDLVELSSFIGTSLVRDHVYTYIYSTGMRVRQ